MMAICAGFHIKSLDRRIFNTSITSGVQIGIKFGKLPSLLFISNEWIGQRAAKTISCNTKSDFDFPLRRVDAFLKPCAKLGISQASKNWNDAANSFSALYAGMPSRNIAFLHRLDNGLADLSKTGEPFSSNGRSAKHTDYRKVFRIIPKVLFVERAKIVGVVKKALNAFDAFASC